jgi:dihydrofolate reductase
MPKLRVHAMTMSLDGYAAGPEQSRDEPLGVGGERLHSWMFQTRMWHEMQGQPGGDEGIDHRFAVEGFEGIGATIMGRNMFGPIRGPWTDEDWRGWWGDEPPYHHPVFVLTHHAHDPIEMAGGTTFHFVTDGIESALEQAYRAADGADVRLGGGPGTVQQYLRAGLVDEMHVPVAPMLLGSGERLFGEDRALPDRYECAEIVPTAAAVHLRFRRRSA